MAKTLLLDAPVPRAWIPAGSESAAVLTNQGDELSRRLLWLIAARTAILFLGLNLARPLGILPDRIGPLPFVPLFNVFSVTLSSAYLVLWWRRRGLLTQLHFQIAVDLFTATLLVAYTRGSESPFLSFYLLIIIYSSLTLGRNGGVIGAALSTILYTGMIALSRMGFLTAEIGPTELNALTYRIGLHVLGFFSVAFLGADLSQRLQAVQAELVLKTDSLRQLQRLTEHIVTSIRSGLCTTDLRGSITLFNSTAEELTGTPRAAVLHRSLQSILSSRLWDRIHEVDLLQDARALRHEEWLTLPGGSRRFLGFSVSPLLDHGRKLIGYVVSFQDLTEIKRLEEEVRVKDRMAAVGRMAAGIAHEIRNPLAAMRGSVEILRSRLELAAADERLLDILIRESDRLNKFVEDFLSFARPSRCTHMPLDLASLLSDSVTLLKNSREVRDRHEIGLQFAGPLAPVNGDADRLKQVFWNLAQNALRAMPSGGSLKITAGPANDGGVEIMFEDTGAGMTEEEKAQLFQPFCSNFGGGTGLGLSIIFQIVEEHRGKIRFDSEKGRGTLVTLSLPGGLQ